VEEKAAEVRASPLYLATILVLLGQTVLLADTIVYTAYGKVFAVDTGRKLPQEIAVARKGEKISSILVLPQSKQVIYSLESTVDGRINSSIRQCGLDGRNQKEVLGNQPGKVQLSDHSPDEKRILFQIEESGTFSVGYLNLRSGKLLRLGNAYSPRFQTNTKVLLLSVPAKQGWCYYLLASWNVAGQKLDTLWYNEEVCNRVINLSRNRKVAALIRSDASSRMAEYIDILDSVGTVINPKVASSTGLVRILGGPKFSPNAKQIVWVAEHWLQLTELGTKETKRLAERLMTDDFAWSPYGGEIAFAFNPPRNPKECSTCPRSVAKQAPGLFTVDIGGSIFERINYENRAEKQIFWIK
jgi:hypothetical protein